MRKTLMIVSAVALTAAAPAFANDFVVQHKDLDLTSAKDQKQLERRIDSEARKFCGASTFRTGSRVNLHAARCYNETRIAARAQMAELTRQARMGG